EHYDLKHEIARGDIVFDVGGYIGLSSLYFSKLVGNQGKVFCFEPNPTNLSRIQTNFSENPELAENIKLYDFGLGEKSEILTMLLSDNIESGHSSTSQLIKGGKTAIPHTQLYEMGFYEHDVKIESLDNFVKNTGIIPNFIKLDIEGAETSFLGGAVETLKNYPITLMIEVHSPLSAFYVLEILNTLGYSAHVLSELWGNRIEILAKVKAQDHTMENKYVHKFLDLHGAHRLKSIRENERELLEKIQAQLQDSQAQLQDAQVQLQGAQVQLQDTQAQRHDTQTQLQGAQAQLQDTQTQFQSTQVQLQDTQMRLSKYQNHFLIRYLRKAKKIYSTIKP
ncbi:MAG TPA: FkbM family methyltransferase, partial [Puia sp.]